MRPALLIAGALVMLISSCRSVPKELPDAEVYSVPRPEGTLLLVSADLAFLHGDLEPLFAKLLGEQLMRNLSRADQLSLALLEERRMAVLIEGRYPKTLSAIALDLDRGWKRSAGSETRWRSGESELTIVRSGTVVLGLPDPDPFVNALTEKGSFMVEREEDFLLSIPAVEKLARGIPVAGECRVAGSFGDQGFLGSLLWNFDSERAARSSLPLLKFFLYQVLNGNDPEFRRDALKTVVDRETVKIDGFRVSPEGIGNLIQQFAGSTGLQLTSE